MGGGQQSWKWFQLWWLHVWNYTRVGEWYQKLYFGCSDLLNDGNGQTLVTVCAVRFFHLVVFYTCRLEQRVVCVCVCVCVCEDEANRRTKTDSGRAWWSGSRLAAPEEFISICCSANRDCLSPAAHSRGEEEDVTLLWSRDSGCWIERFKEKTTAELLSAYSSLCWHSNEWPINS